MSERDVSVERAARLRAVLDECERILGDKDETPERHEAAATWLNRLTFTDEHRGYPSWSVSVSVASAGHERHTHGLGHALNDDYVLEGWQDRA